jgi:predicted ATPase
MDLLVGDRLLATNLHYGGNHDEARHLLERCVHSYAAPPDQRHEIWFHHDQRLVARTMLARVLCLQGLADQAKRHAQLSIEEAEAANHQLGLCYALAEAVCPVALMTDDIALAEQAVTRLIEHTRSHSFIYWARFSRWLEGKVLIKRGETAKGFALLRSAFDAFRKAGLGLHCSGFVGDLAATTAELTDLAAGLRMIDEALAQSDRDGVSWHVPELHRVKAELMIAAGGSQQLIMAEDCLGRALAAAKQQNALLFELRSAASLAGLKLGQHRPDEARQILAPVYDRFTEGFDTADLRQARALLETAAAR